MEIEEIARKFKGNFPLYSKNVLRIVTKEGESKPFVLNAAQLYVHNMLEQQLKDQGNIRALVLKARQTGISTYTQGRNFWKVTQNRNANAFVLTLFSIWSATSMTMSRTLHLSLRSRVSRRQLLYLTRSTRGIESEPRGLPRLVEDKQTDSSMGQRSPSTPKGQT